MAAAMLLRSRAAANLGQMLRAHARVDLVRLAQQRVTQARQVPGRVALTDRIAVVGPHRRPGAVAVGEVRAEPRLEALGRSLDGDIGERRRLSPMLAEGPMQKDPQQVANPLHQPPCSCGMNRVCSTLRIELVDQLAGAAVAAQCHGPEAFAGQLPEAFFGERYCVRVGNIELVPRIARAIHNNLDGHCLRSFLLTKGVAYSPKRAKAIGCPQVCLCSS